MQRTAQPNYDVINKFLTLQTRKTLYKNVSMWRPF